MNALILKKIRGYIINKKWSIKQGYFALFLLVFYAFNLHAFNNGNSAKSKPMIGHAPYISSIRAIISDSKSGVYTTELKPYNGLYVGAKIGIPIFSCAYEDLNADERQINIFEFNDLDGDKCDLKPEDLKWYILDNQDTGWENINGIDDLIITEIMSKESPDNIDEPQNNYPLSQLIVPMEAVGKRIGFIYQPSTLEGVPNIGPAIKVWDLNYTFNQNPILTPEQNKITNHGSRNTLIKNNSAGGIVPPIIEPPAVDDVYLSGRFGINESLELNYTFISNTQNAFEDVSRFRWGLDAPLEELSEWSRSPISPKLTINEIGKTYGLFFQPLKLENELIVQGQELIKVTTDDISSAIVHAPVIENLNVLGPNLESLIGVEDLYLRPGEIITVTYDFTSEQNDIYDNSIYTWMHNETEQVVASGEVSQDNKTIEYSITEQDLGNSLKFTITPRDSSQLIGVPMELSTPNLIGLGAITELALVADPQINFPLSATYVFNQLKTIHSEDKSSFRWYYINDADEEIELSSGVIEISGIVPSSPDISIDLRGKSVYLDITPRDQFGIIGNTLTIKAEIPNITNIYLFGDNELDLSIYIPVKLDAMALFSDKTTLDISELGDWSINNDKFEITENNKLKADADALGEQVTVTFNFQGQNYEAIVKVVASKLSDIIGSETNYITIISSEDTPIIDLYGMGIWDAIREPQTNKILAGGTGGKLGGNPQMLNTSQFNFNKQIRSIDSISILGSDINNSMKLLHTLSWKDDQSVSFHFKGDHRLENVTTTEKSLVVTDKVFGWIVYSSGKVGSSGVYIMGLQLVYY